MSRPHTSYHEVLAIRSAYASHKKSIQELANEYDRSYPAIWNIVHCNTFKEIPNPHPVVPATKPPVRDDDSVDTSHDTVSSESESLTTRIVIPTTQYDALMESSTLYKKLRATMMDKPFTAVYVPTTDAETIELSLKRYTRLVRNKARLDMMTVGS